MIVFGKQTVFDGHARFYREVPPVDAAFRLLAWWIVSTFLASACRPAAEPPPLTAQVSGEIKVVGLAAPVRVVRDRWGVPHIFAETLSDVFLAQGFVQAQDRLFQMELWRRAAAGRLAEMLGANFIERDAMTRRLQYQDDPDGDWASYGAEVRRDAEAFVAGINAWVALARERPPELFAAAGWQPAFWSAADLLNRTDAYDRDATIASAEATGLPATVVDAVRRAAAPAFFTGLARRPAAPPTAILPARTSPSDADSIKLPAPSTRYLIHLYTPNWNAIGAAVPWRPGLVVGHDGTATFDRPDPKWRAVIREMPLAPAEGRTVKDVIEVKGRAEPFVSATLVTPNGVVIATDREAGKQYALTWPGHETGTAPAFVAGGKGAEAHERAEAQDGRERSDVVFHHALAISPSARARFDIGPLPAPAKGMQRFFVQPDSKVWDASRAMNAPGQSEDPDSSHHADLALLWARGQAITLAFSEAAVAANVETTLLLVPAAHR
jgi:Penicillin amidase